ncbi:hypothetical protein HMP0721_2481 [Pseudoramibacter alactolyticus ATCC 23263]|uniref:Uncharacterized protein n=1 Tax=Pseudoramibacter alactolyticus ATCC 23263 TaxID=887929 RepID=E6MKE5_9FIRM|nr:hypothetical protein HMP0721_2481 [Pseudoramibacter alactolyticus ATCC 23263]
MAENDLVIAVKVQKVAAHLAACAPGRPLKIPAVKRHVMRLALVIAMKVCKAHRGFFYCPENNDGAAGNWRCLSAAPERRHRDVGLVQLSERNQCECLFLDYYKM